MSRNILGIFDGGDVSEISALVDKLEKSSFDYLKLEGDGISIVIGKNGAGEAGLISTAPATAAAVAPATTAAPAVEPAAQTGTPAEEPAAKPAVSEQEGVFIIRAPSQGLFFAQPEPGAPPYVTVGSSVSTGDTVCLIEIMKTYSALTSPVDGEVIAVHVVNEEYLEPDQPLVSIRVK